MQTIEECHLEIARTLGRRIAEARVTAEYEGAIGLLSQERLAAEISLSRSQLAHIEEGTSAIEPALIRQICQRLKIPGRAWEPLIHPWAGDGAFFQYLTSEMAGKPLNMDHLEGVDACLGLSKMKVLFGGGLNVPQLLDQFNSVLVFLGEKAITFEFFDRFLGPPAFVSLSAYKKRVREFQKVGMRLHGNFRRAWFDLSRTSSLEEKLRPLESFSPNAYHLRREVTEIEEIAPENLRQLGYIAVREIKKERTQREELNQYLIELAHDVDARGDDAFERLDARRRRRIASLLDELGVQIRSEDINYAPLYSKRLNSSMLREEAARVAPDDDELEEMEQTQQIALRNLAAYLTDSHMDAYVATSMREDADFVSVNAFSTRLFASETLAPLKLRYFNPTQSWIDDRVAKGIVEALMLRRSKLAIYMAQKGDTFGKDSEASVALGQGKPVVVYVPRLYHTESGIDSEELSGQSESELIARASQLGDQPEEGLDKRELFKLVLRRQLNSIGSDELTEIVFTHWADFDLHGEVIRISDASLREACIEYLGKATPLGAAVPPDVVAENAVRSKLIDIIVEVAAHFESRATTFRDVHPLALQVIVKSGVLNGIIVVRSIDDCATIVYQLLTNTIETFVDEDDNNYLLLETKTRSVMRVVSKNKLLTNAFWTHYFDELPGSAFG